MQKNKVIIITLLLVSAGAFLYFFNKKQDRSENKSAPETTIVNSAGAEIVAQNLDIPWEIAFLPGGEMLVTERPGKLLKIGAQTKTVKKIEGVKHIGEGGLLGLSLHPDFVKNNYIYLYSTTQDSSGISNRVERYKFENDTLTDRKVILEGIKGSVNHDGGRIAFGPDGYLYVTTGDAGSPDLAQDKNSLNGKILRITEEGDIPSDNPFGNEVYSLGHRNPQGLAWDEKGVLWETEHGPSGLETGNDEINIIYKGGNYGWPTIKGDETREGLISPVIQSGTEETWAPSGMAYYKGSLFFSGLRGESLFQVKIKNDNSLVLTSHFKKEYGRIRAVVLGPDGYIYFSTSNNDGRGRAKSGDDKIFKVDPRPL
ncbi:hypothetical protein A2208_02395 [Candidatus Woesebacteria bacterium RIFOXYA1_FULL_43_16]|nr:MAG: hypothetical protein A2208_02395 [Candidatus Woesebacteria bacterium RIFOXYA1_FULL_43_16]